MSARLRGFVGADGVTGALGGQPRLSLETPERVPLTFELAPLGSRLAAVTIDVVIVFIAVAIVGAIASALASPSSGELFGDIEVDDATLFVESIVQLAVFFLWNFYFIFTELRWQGRTIGKRVCGLRVIARDGGPLSSGLVFARNLTRDIEMLLPLMALVYPQLLGLESGWALLVCWIWLGILALMPLFNRHRARVGDLIAGTLVVSAPREALLADLVSTGGGAQGGPSRAGAPGDDPWGFTTEQLDLYGIHELQILEDVLRRYPDEVDHDLLETIAAKIRAKLDWSPPPELAATGRDRDTHAFLRAFYAAQRARLEHKMLFGKRQERKVR